jgi:predicted phage terminase large subunit-like protein
MLINNALLRIASGELSRLIVQMPPRHGKSWLMSEFAPPWFIGNFGWNVILASYEANFAAHWGGRARAIIRQYGEELFNCRIRGRDQEKWWETSNGGGMLTAGVDGPITGKGGRLLMIDDPVKNAEQASSVVYQQKAQEWYDTTFRSRLEPDGAVCLTATRWNQNDLLGYVQDKTDQEWEVLTLPALALPGDPLGREEGEALWPERYDETALQELKDGMSSYWWSALYQQRPTSDEGNIFPRANWQRYTALPPLQTLRGGIYCDTAGWEKDSNNDYGVIAVWLFDGVRFYVADVQRGRWDFPDFTRRVLDMQASWKGLRVVVEETPWAKPLIQTLKAKVPGVIGWSTEGKSKENRARSVQHYPEGLSVSIPERAAWVSDWIEEHAAFPYGTHDDMVDTSVMAMLDLAGALVVRADQRENVARYRRTLGPAKG